MLLSNKENICPAEEEIGHERTPAARRGHQRTGRDPPDAGQVIEAVLVPAWYWSAVAAAMVAIGAAVDSLARWSWPWSSRPPSSLSWR